MAAPLIQAIVHRLHSLVELGNEERIAAWRTAWAVWLDHPWLGVGPDNLPGVWFRYADPALPRGLLFSRAHSEPLHILVSTGVLGLAVACAGAAALAQVAISQVRTAPGFAPVIAALAAFCAVVLPGFHVIPTASLAAICAGVLMGGEHGHGAMDRRRGRR